MKMLFHNLKVAVRNLMKYKLQTIISVLSIAIGIVTLAFAHSAVSGFKLPAIYGEPYYDRAYSIRFEPLENGESQLNPETHADNQPQSVNSDIIRALKRDGGMKCVEQIAVPNGIMYGGPTEYHLCDSTVRKVQMNVTPIDPEYPNYIGLRSAVTGDKIKILKAGEAIISKEQAAIVFDDANPIGAIQCLTSGHQPIPVTIVDVYDDISLFDRPLDNRNVYYALEKIENIDISLGNVFYAAWVNAVLKEGCTEQQLQKEVNARVKHFGLRAKLSKESDNSDVNTILTINLLVHLIGSLILVAAIIGFLRMQIQLFWTRRREVSLRIINGAKRVQLFGTFIAEVLLSIGLSVVVAILMGTWGEEFIYLRFADVLSDARLSIHSLSQYSLYTGVLLFVVCGIAIWISLLRICKAEQGLAANMRNSRTHLFRNMMLGIQIIISIIFVCGTLILLNWSNKMMANYNLPEDDDYYKQCVLLRPHYADEPKRLIKEIEHLEDLDKMIMCGNLYLSVREIEDNPEALSAFNNKYYKNFLCVTDTSILSFYDIEVNWFKEHIDRNQCLIINEVLYKKLCDLGLVNNGVLSIVNNGQGNCWTLPIAGTIKGIPYSDRETSIMIHPDMEIYSSEYALIPKAGKYQSLMQDVEETIHRLEPSIVNKMAYNFRDGSCTEATLVEGMRTVGWVLGAISIIICAMSIYSTIALDTRSRKKEVAIRKVNGAKSKDIYRLFGRMYFILIFLSLFIAIPVSVIFNNMMSGIVSGVIDGCTISPIIPCIAGSITIILTIAFIVILNIRKIMCTNPTEIIAKE